MANKVFKGIRMPGLNDFYVLPEAVAIEDENGYVEIKSYVSDTVEIENLDTTLTKSGMAADAAEVGKILNQKVDKVDGEAQYLTVEDSLTIKRGNQAEGAYFYTYVDDHNYPTVELLGTANDDFVKLYGIANPTQSNDAVNKQYVDTNFAPVGYGLGGETKDIGTTSVDNISGTGWYWGYIGLPDGFGYSHIHHIERNANYITQIAYSLTNVSDWGAICVRREKTGGVWQPWEWENPPYEFGKVYRTTERFAGYPVYAVNVACGMAVHGETAVTVTKGITDDPNFSLGYEWSIVGYDGGVVYDAVYNGRDEHDMLIKMGEYPIWYAIKGIKATWSNAGLTLTFEPTGNHSMNTMEGNMFVTVKFIKKEYL